MIKKEEKKKEKSYRTTNSLHFESLLNKKESFLLLSQLSFEVFLTEMM